MIDSDNNGAWTLKGSTHERISRYNDHLDKDDDEALGYRLDPELYASAPKRKTKRKKMTLWFWINVILAIVLVVVGFQFFKANTTVKMTNVIGQDFQIQKTSSSP